jgi:HEAT repeat protein
MTTDDTVPVAAAYALGSIGAKDVDEPLQTAAKDEDPFLQMIATWALAKLHPEDEAVSKAAVEKLIDGLKSENVTIRHAAARGLQLLNAPPEMVAPGLVALLDDPNPEIHANATDAIASLGETVVPKLSNALKSPELRVAAAGILAKLGPKAAAAVQPLIEAANIAEPKFRTDIQLALGAIGPDAAPATDMLAKSISSSDAGERESALYALRQIGPGAKAAIPALQKRMAADDSFEADAAAWALARIAPQDTQVAAAVVTKLTQELTDADEQTRLECIEALADMGAAGQATAALENVATEDSSPLVRAAAEAALKK